MTARGSPQNGDGLDSVVEGLVFQEVDRDRWRDLERLFESPGGPKYCWCMVWRSVPKETSRTDSKVKKAEVAPEI